MAGQGIKITDLRPEVQTLVNSDPKKYDSNANGKIDDGVELSQLLSEYQCKAEDLTSADKKEPMWTTAEQVDIIKRTAKKDNVLNYTLALGVGLTSFLGLLGACASESGKGALKVLGVAGLIIGTMFGCTDLCNKPNKKEAQLELKAEQSQKGTATMQERLKQEAEMREREAALKQDELEYRERMNDATQGVDTKLKSVERRANNINKNLKEAEAKTTAKKDSVA